MTKVVFKKFSDGEVIAFFPQEPGTIDPATMMSYMHVGQHSSAHEDVAAELEAATPLEYADLQRELVRQGYKDLDVQTEITPGDRRAREDSLTAMI